MTLVHAKGLYSNKQPMSLPVRVTGENTLRTAQDVHAVLTLQTQVVPAIMALQKQVTDVGKLEIGDEIQNLAEVSRSTLSTISNRIIELAFDGVNAYVQQSVRHLLYNICDAGQYLDGQSKCLNKYTGVQGSANRCFYLAVMSALQDAERRAGVKVHNLTETQALKIHDLGTYAEETKSEALSNLNGIVGLPSCVVGVWYTANKSVTGITFTETLSYVSSQDREVLTLHILNIQNKHFVALIPTETDESNSACTGCDDAENRVGLCQGKCKNGEQCCKKVRKGQTMCSIHRSKYITFDESETESDEFEPGYRGEIREEDSDDEEVEEPFAQTQGYT
jgi:hypothetical protein